MNSFWPPYYKVDFYRKHVEPCYLFFFSHLLLRYVNGNMCEKGGIVLKPVRRRCIRDCWLTVWSLMMSGQVLAGWLLNEVFRKTTCWDDSTKGNRPARKPLVITQPIFKQEGAKWSHIKKKGGEIWNKKGVKILVMWEEILGSDKEGEANVFFTVSQTKNWNMQVILSTKLQCAFVFIVWACHKWDMAGSIVCITSKVMFSSVFTTQTKIKRNAST